ncbi:MAG TPA: DUF1592 domain-containing protein, partial [Verrucomicrobiae bacterium]|nr:DUF1592 domain-containing protein [Verrucomicrobiae bacterium]
AENPAAAHFRKDVQPILVKYCYDCHGDGMNKGKVAFDEFKSDDELLGKHDLWSKVLKNLRGGLMPPEKKPRPSAEEVRRLENWVKREAFGIDPKDPDPGRVTIRRLNRVEYRNTIRDLMGFDFKVDDELPPDDTGYGFDNIGDVLTVSPMLLEKYMQAAETIVAAAVPRVTRVVREKTISGNAFRKPDSQGSGGRNNDRYSFYDDVTLAHVFKADQEGSYRVELELEVGGQFDFDPGRCRVVFKVNDRELLSQELGWHNNKKFRFNFDEKWTASEHRMTLELHPLTPVEQKKNSLDLRIAAVRVQGPQEKEHWVRPKNFELFFSKDPPEEIGARRLYAREVLSRFANKAYRRPVDDRTLDRLAAIAESVYSQPGKGFEDGVAQAMVPVLASPRFLFRVEETTVAAGVPPAVEPGVSPGETGARSKQGTKGGKVGADGKMPSSTAGGTPATTVYPLVDEYSLASRLSYFFWSTMPDEELFRLAGQGELRKNLGAQVKRMLGDVRSQELVENFVGQWLQVRDVEGIDINARVVLARDSGQEGSFQRDRRRFQELRDIPDEKLTSEQRAELEKMREQFRRRQNRPQVELDRDLRRALRQETEMLFAHVLRTDRSVLELINSGYTFLNERLARHYGITNVFGNEMRRVDLPEDHPRGGVLTHGSVLIVTSNPTRTSPVKRGLFILDNLLGTPPPPPPADIPQLEESEKEFKDRQPTLREVLAIHREKPLCSSCHNRMDPLGLALENFNALGMWREKERGQPVDATGKLITGEPFQSINDVKRILTNERRMDFYRCLTEKLLTYALGRGVEYYDVESVDQIVERLEKENGRFSALLMGIIESAPFQKRRTVSAVTSVEPTGQAEQRVLTKSEL